jgi:type IV fimbrial biogenesis protein FimT
MSRVTLFRRRGAGFTVVELLFTVLIASILLAVAVPSFRGMTASNRLVTQTNDLIGAMNFARSEAITRNRTITFCRADSDVDTDCSASAGDWDFWIVRNSVGEVSRRGELPAYGGAMRVTSSLAIDRIDFGADGLARSSAGGLLTNQQINVCSTYSAADNRRAIMLGAASRVSVTRSTSAGVC